MYTRKSMNDRASSMFLVFRLLICFCHCSDWSCLSRARAQSAMFKVLRMTRHLSLMPCLMCLTDCKLACRHMNWLVSASSHPGYLSMVGCICSDGHRKATGCLKSRGPGASHIRAHGACCCRHECSRFGVWFVDEPSQIAQW